MDLNEFLKTRYRLSDETLSLLNAEMEPICVARGEVILKEGQTDRYIYFIESGIVRSSILRDGKEITVFIASEGQSPLTTTGMTRTDRSKISIVALIDCVLWRLPRRRLGELCRESLDFANLARELAESIISETEIYWTDYYLLDKKTQYRLLIKQQPELFQRLSLGEIASYLGITPQSLSRIRAETD